MRKALIATGLTLGATAVTLGLAQESAHASCVCLFTNEEGIEEWYTEGESIWVEDENGNYEVWVCHNCEWDQIYLPE